MSITQKIKQFVYPFLYREKTIYIPESTALQGKVIIVAGGTGAVGAAMCDLLYKQGATIIILGRNEAKMSELEGKYDQRRFMTTALDITNIEACQKEFQIISTKWGKIDALVNATGAFLFDTLENITMEQWNNLINININAAYTLSKAAIPHMKKNKSGTIIHLGSKISHNTNLGAGRVAYATTKYALEGFCYALSQELKKDRIRVCCLMPGTISTFLALHANSFLSPSRVAQLVSVVLQMDDVDFESILFTSSFQTYS